MPLHNISRCPLQYLLLFLDSGPAFFKVWNWCITEIEWHYRKTSSISRDAPTTSELSTILLPIKVRLILEVLRYIYSQMWYLAECYLGMDELVIELTKATPYSYTESLVSIKKSP